MTSSSILIPAAGVLTQPILARGLGVGGRGELAAALAPSLLTIAVATLGLPDALTYYLAKHPRITRPSVLWAAGASVVMGVVCLLAGLVTLPFLSAGDPHLGHLIFLGMVLAIPSLVVGVLRGAATGRQMWFAVAADRAVNIAARVIALIALFAVGRLTVIAALVVTAGAPLLAGLVYWQLFRRPPGPRTDDRIDGPTLRLLVTFGNKVWLGSVASMLLSRIAQLLMTPLSTVEDLGLYSVATTISDLPLLVALAIAGALFGVNSASRNAAKTALTSRLTLLVSCLGSIGLGATLPWWIGPLFGPGFDGAINPTLMLLFSAVVCVPGLMAATGVGAWGRPGLRSIGLVVTLVVNTAALVLLVPTLGVTGATLTSILSNVVMTTFMVVAASRVMQVPIRDFLIIRRSDVARLWAEMRGVAIRLLRRRSGAGT